jgi:diacylglycerol kinase family enzyme
MSASDTVVIFNPKAGRGRARKLVQEVRAWAAPDAELRATQSAGHGTSLAEVAAREGVRRVIAAGGDGTVHEVANGLLRSGNSDVIFAVWPLGSANDYAFALELEPWWQSLGRQAALKPARLDVGIVRSGPREKFFVNCLGLGFNGMVALESRAISWLRGLPLYTLAFIRAMLWRFETPQLHFTWGNENWQQRTLAMSINLGRREGNFPITKDAVLDDGLFDCVHIGQLRRWEMLRHLPALMSGNLPKDHPQLRLGRSSRVKVQGQTPLCVHVEGEFFCRPEDDIRELEIELLPGRLWVECGTPAVHQK